MDITGAHINYNSQVDNGFSQGFVHSTFFQLFIFLLLLFRKSNEEPIPRFDKMLEDFYCLCNQIELCLVYIL